MGTKEGFEELCKEWLDSEKDVYFVNNGKRFKIICGGPFHGLCGTIESTDPKSNRHEAKLDNGIRISILEEKNIEFISETQNE